MASPRKIYSEGLAWHHNVNRSTLVEHLRKAQKALREPQAAEIPLDGDIEQGQTEDERHRRVYLEDPEGHVLVFIERQVGGPQVLVCEQEGSLSGRGDR